MYASDASWKQKVEDLARRSKFVVLQMGQTPGILWEFDALIATIDPRRLLIITGRSGADAYDLFRLRTSKFLPEPLPAVVGDFPFALAFRENWEPRVLSLPYRTSLLSAFHYSPLDFARGLKPFLDDVPQGG